MIFGLVLFLLGFFLTRRELLSYSTFKILDLALKDESLVSLTHQLIDKQNNYHQFKQYERVMLFIVDGLRLDFVTKQNSTENVYNKLTFIHELIQNNSSQCALFGFAADAPTTTLQRLKALMTGSFPTFFEFSNNFNHNDVLYDDNLIFQLKQNNLSKNQLIILGDDTWESLFPSVFDVSHTFDSFNTKDLYHVDNGIEDHLSKQLTMDWKLLIAHFLGVDHVGHTYHAFHPLMEERLIRMNNLLKNVVESISDDTLLVFMGDHGMTNDGNHGGATFEEVHSAIFFYSKKPLVKLSNKDVLYWNTELSSFQPVSIDSLLTDPKVIPQIDFVPTISLLLGLPIPFSSLGKVIPELFALSEVTLLRALYINSLQVTNYLHDYFGDKLPYSLKTSFSSAIKKLLSTNIAIETMEPISSQLLEYLSHVFEFGRIQYTQFNELSMVIGVLMMIVSFLHQLLIPNKYESKTFFSFPLISILSLLFGYSFGWDITLICQSIYIINIIINMIDIYSCLNHISITSFIVNTKTHWINSIATIFMLFHSIGPFSDNMIKQELSIVWILSLILSLVIYFNYNRYHEMWISICLHIFLFVLALPIQGNIESSNKFISLSTLQFLYHHLQIHSKHRDYLLIVSHLCLMLFWLDSGSWIIKTMFPRLLLVILGINFMRSYWIHSIEMGWSSLLTLFGLVSGINSLILSCLCFYQIRRIKYNIQVTNWSIGIFISFISRLLFFLTGHKLSFSSLQLDVAFIGMERFHFTYGGLMLFLNTFGMEVLILILVSIMFTSYQSKHQIYQSYLIHRKILLINSCMSCLILRRHLMVWAIFAPKLIFESCFYIICHIVVTCIMNMSTSK